MSKKFFLKRGKNHQYENQYTNLLHIATKNYNSLKNIANKDRLSTLKILAVIYWKKLTNRQIAQFLIMIGNTFFLSDRIKQKLSISVKFTTQDI